MRDVMNASIRADFPILKLRVHGKPLVYLDNAATTQKPQAVIERLSRYYREENANIHRGVHTLSVDATEAYDEARERVQRFINAAEAREIVFVRGATEAINLVAATFGRARVAAGDEIVLSHMEHHSNIVPWQMLCEEKGARLRVIPITDAGELRLDEYERLLGPRTRLVAVTHVSNALGTINPVESIVRTAHDRGIPVLVDGAQAVAHMRVDVQAIGCDFYVFSGHKVFGPTGVGVLYARGPLLDAMPPYQGGGDMIRSVTFERTLYKDGPGRFEAGTPNIAGALGGEHGLGLVRGGRVVEVDERPAVHGQRQRGEVLAHALGVERHGSAQGGVRSCRGRGRDGGRLHGVPPRPCMRAPRNASTSARRPACGMRSETSRTKACTSSARASASPMPRARR